MKKIFALMTLFIAIFALAACGEREEPIDEDQVAVDNAVGALIVGGLSQLTGNVTLPTQGRNNTTITWASSNPAVISNTGAVTQPEVGEASIVVTLTATVSRGEASATREFEALVLPKEPSNAFSDFALLHQESALRDKIEVEGIVVSHFRTGFFVFDGEHSVGVYNPGGNLPPIGASVIVAGEYANYHTLYQVNWVTEIQVLSQNNAFEVPVTEITIEAFNALDFTNRLYHGAFFEVTGNLVVKGAFDNMFLESDDSDEDLLIYFDGEEASLEALEAFVGRTITIVVQLYANHGTNGVMVNFFGTADDVVVAELNDAQAVAADVAAFADSILVTFESNIDLPDNGPNGSTFTGWTSSHPELIANDGSYQEMPETPTLITFTATAQRGDETATVSIRVDSLAPITIEEALEVPVGRNVYITGKVVEIVAANSGFFVFDGTGYIYVRDTSFWGEYNDEIVVGDSWSFVGVRDLFAGLPQIAVLRLFEESDATFPEEVNNGLVPISDVRAGNLIPGALYTFYGQVREDVGNFMNYDIIDGDARSRIHHNSNNLIFGDASLYNDEDKTDGKWVVFVGRPFQWAHSNAFVTFFGTVDDISTDALTEAQEAELAANSLALPGIVSGDITLPATGRFDTTITWASSNLDVIANDGTVTQGTDDVEVTLTATVVKGGASVDVELVVTVAAKPLTVSEALEVASGAVLVQGVVTNVLTNLNATIEDENSGIVIRLSSAQLSRLSVGDIVIIEGNRSAFNGLAQIVNQDADYVIKIVESNVDIPESNTINELDFLENSNWLPFQSRRVNLNGAVVKSIGTVAGNGSFNVMLELPGTEREIAMRYEGTLNNEELSDLLLALEVGSVINVQNVTVGWFNNPQFAITDSSQIED